jgi:hypothetical protein
MVKRVEEFCAEFQRRILPQASHLGGLGKRYIPVVLSRTKHLAKAAMPNPNAP